MAIFVVVIVVVVLDVVVVDFVVVVASGMKGMNVSREKGELHW